MSDEWNTVEDYWDLVGRHALSDPAAAVNEVRKSWPGKFELSRNLGLLLNDGGEEGEGVKGIRFRCIFCGLEFDTVEECNDCENSH